MPIYLRQSTASQEVPLGYFLDATDGDTAMIALTISNTDIKLWKTGATTLADKNSGGATHISGGIYYIVLDATDTDTLGSLIIFVHEATALAIRVECVVLAANVYDSLIAGTDLLDANTAQWLGTAVATPTVAGVPEVDVTHLNGVAQSLLDLKDFADDGYDPSTNKVQGVVLTDTVTTYTGNTPQTGDSFARLGLPAAASVSADILAIDNLVDDLESRVGTPSNFGSGATVAANLVDIEGQTDDIGVAGAGLTALASAASIAALNNLSSAQAETAATNALNTYDPPTSAELVSEINSVQSDIAALSIPSAATIAAAVWAAATRILTAGTNIVLAKGVGVTGFNDLSSGQVNAEMVDALNVDTYPEPGQGAPGATLSLAAKINYLYKAWRNRNTQTATQYNLYADNATTIDQKATVSDDGTTFDRSELTSGP